MLERIKPEFLKRRTELKNEEIAISEALNKGVPPQLLQDLGQEKPEIDDPRSSRYIFWGALTGVVIGIGVYFGADQIPSDITLDPNLVESIDLVTSWLVKDIPDTTLRATVKAAAEFEAKAAGLLVAFTYIRATVENRVKNIDTKLSISEKRRILQDLIKSGEAPIEMPKGYVGIDLGTHGDTIGRSLGERLGWGTKALAFQEGSENHSGYHVWARLPNPTEGIGKEEYFSALDRTSFADASAFVLCPVHLNQAFLPDINNKNHFDMSFNEIIDRIRLIDEYCDERSIPKKKIIVVGDKNLTRTVGPYTDNGMASHEVHVLEDTIAEMSEERKAPIYLADPTEIVLDTLSSEAYNPQGLLFEFFEDPNAEEIYGERFAKRCGERNIDVKTNADPNIRSLHITYGVNDIATRGATGMLDPNDTVAVIIDEARGISDPYKSVVLSEVVSKYIQRLLTDEK